MIRTINEYDFIDAFKKMGRENNFSYDGLVALYDYLEMLEDDTGQPYNLDVIALCCEYREFDNLEEFQADYGDEYETIEDIQNATSVIMIDDYEVKELNDTRFIIQQF
tara:strand:- start:253 stop:576 length:324 start_codon:yes stop_codon:yes gene_type:complete